VLPEYRAETAMLRRFVWRWRSRKFVQAKAAAVDVVGEAVVPGGDRGALQETDESENVEAEVSFRPPTPADSEGSDVDKSSEEEWECDHEQCFRHGAIIHKGGVSYADLRTKQQFLVHIGKYAIVTQPYDHAKWASVVTFHKQKCYPDALVDEVVAAGYRIIFNDKRDVYQIASANESGHPFLEEDT
jgi:hypothetical protein